MTLSILSAATKISPSAYLTACKRAVDTGDGQRVQSLIEQAESCLSEPLPALTGVAILHAYTNGHRNMAKDLIAQCTSEQIAAAPPNLLRLVAERLDFQTAMELVDKGVQPGDYAADVLHTLTGQHQEWMAEKLLEHGMPVAADMLVIHGSAAETKDYERAIILIGSAWGLDPQNAVSHLELITREKEAARGTAEPEETRHVLPESELPMNASGMETLDNVCGLFETAIQLESRDHREALFRLASKLMETQNLLDWIEKTPEEQELPELAES